MEIGRSWDVELYDVEVADTTKDADLSLDGDCATQALSTKSHTWHCNSHHHGWERERIKIQLPYSSIIELFQKKKKYMLVRFGDIL